MSLGVTLWSCLVITKVKERKVKCHAARLLSAWDLGLRSIILEGDSLEVITLLKGSLCDCPWTVSSFIADCKL